MQLARVYRDTGRPELALPELDHVLSMTVRSPMEREARDEALQIQADIYAAFSSS